MTVHHDVTVETRDGTGLATDVYRPANPKTGDGVAGLKPALEVGTVLLDVQIAMVERDLSSRI